MRSCLVKWKWSNCPYCKLQWCLSLLYNSTFRLLVFITSATQRFTTIYSIQNDIESNFLQTSCKLTYLKNPHSDLWFAPPPLLEFVANLFFCVVEIFTKASLGVIIVKSMHEMFYILISQNLCGNRVKVRLILFYS